MVKVLYNGVDVFGTNGAPTPFVSISDQMINYGQRWGVAKSITLNGMITGVGCLGNTNSYQDLLAKQSGLYNSFSQDFKTLVITDSSTVAFSGNYVRVNSIDFDRSAYFRTLNFKVGLIYYPPELFSGTFGVTSPTASIKYTEQQDRTVNITQSISAKGFNTSSTSNNSLSNAVAYVQSLTGTSALIQPTFIPIFANSLNPNGISITGIYPKKISENINRIEGTYSVNIDYSIRETAQTSTVLNYTTDISYDETKGFYTASLKGSLKGTRNQQISDVRNEFNTYFNAYNLVSYIFNTSINPPSNVVLNPNVESYNINEIQETNTIDFSYNYTTDPQTVKFDYTVDLNGDDLRDMITVEFNGTLTAKGPQNLRLPQLEASLANLNVVTLCQDYYLNNAKTSTAPFNPILKKYAVKRNLTNSNNSFVVTASFDNSPIPVNPAFKSFVWSIAISPSINTYIPIQYLNGDNAAFNMNYYKRGKIAIQGTALLPDNSDYSSLVRTEALNILNQYASSFTKRVRVEDKVHREQFAEENGYGYSFSIADSCETPIFSI